MVVDAERRQAQEVADMGRRDLRKESESDLSHRRLDDDGEARELRGALLGERHDRWGRDRTDLDTEDLDALQRDLSFVGGGFRDLPEDIQAFHHVAERSELAGELRLVRHADEELGSTAGRIPRQERGDHRTGDEFDVVELRLKAEVKSACAVLGAPPGIARDGVSRLDDSVGYHAVNRRSRIEAVSCELEKLLHVAGRLVRIELHDELPGGRPDEGLKTRRAGSLFLRGGRAGQAQ